MYAWFKADYSVSIQYVLVCMCLPPKWASLHIRTCSHVCQRTMLLLCVCVEDAFPSTRTGLMVCLHPLKFRGGFTVPALASEDEEGGSTEWGPNLFLCVLFLLLAVVSCCDTLVPPRASPSFVASPHFRCFLRSLPPQNTYSLYHLNVEYLSLLFSPHSFISLSSLRLSFRFHFAPALPSSVLSRASLSLILTSIISLFLLPLFCLGLALFLIPPVSLCSRIHFSF